MAAKICRTRPTRDGFCRAMIHPQLLLMLYTRRSQSNDGYCNRIYTQQHSAPLIIQSPAFFPGRSVETKVHSYPSRPRVLAYFSIFIHGAWVQHPPPYLPELCRIVHIRAIVLSATDEREHRIFLKIIFLNKEFF